MWPALEWKKNEFLIAKMKQKLASEIGQLDR